jgi:predicted TIM-barrel fold metal-dependent hydrolase
MLIIDAHTHCGDNRETKFYPIEEVRRHLDEAGADGAVIFAFPEDMYRIVDSPESRRRANEYVLQVAEREKEKVIHPFYFVWNDFIIPENLDRYDGIKWHRHADEPRYDYESPQCERMLQRIRELRLPVLLEEEFAQTVAFVRRMRDVPVIIPHMGQLNGGPDAMEVFFDEKHVFFDTSVAPLEVIERILNRVGPERVIFGSDVSGTKEPFFNFPRVELEKLYRLPLSDADRSLILGGNIERLLPCR